MIENTAILKIGGGLVAASGVGGAGYYAFSTGALSYESSFIEKESEKNYLIVKSVNFQPTDLKKSLYEQKLFGSLTKNFKCTFDTKEDNECEIYKLTDKEKSLSKLTIKNISNTTTEGTQKQDNFFKLVIKKTELLTAINAWEDSTKTISLKENGVKDNAKTFSELIPVYKVVGGKIVDGNKASLITKVTETDVASISQPSTEITNTTTKNYECQLLNEKFDCDIAEITVDTKKTVIFKTQTSSNTLSNSNIKNKDKQFEIKAIKSYFENIDYSEKLDVIAKPSTDNKKYSVLTPQFLSWDKKIISGKDNFVFAVAAAKSSTGTADTTWTNYSKCLIGNDKAQKTCSIYKFNSTQTTSTTTENLNFSGNLTALTQDSDIAENNYYVIKFNSAEKNFLGNETIIQLISTDQTKKAYSFTAKSNMYLDATASGTTQTVNAVYIFE